MATETIIGNYRIEEVIGRGGMGVVYRGRHTTLPREVAVKSINAKETDDLRRLRSRFEKEAYIQSQLDHPGIVKIYDYIVAEQTYYIVMEYVEGRSLAQVLDAECGPLESSRALDIIEQILAAINCAHTFVYRDQDGLTRQGLIHRDLKPANILITPEDRVKITDFGIVKLVGTETTDTFGSGYGTPRYVSPEQAEGRPVDQRSDIYSLGVILYEMLTGSPPFGGDDPPLTRTETLRAHVESPPPRPSEKNPEITPEIERAILRALEKEPDRRFASAEEFWREVRRARGRPTDALPECENRTPVLDRVGTQAVYNPAMETVAMTSRQDYETQPISVNACASCGASIPPGARHCTRCGQDVSASPSTARLKKGETVNYQKRNLLGLWAAAVLLALALVGTLIFYARQKGATNSNQSAASPAPAQASPTPVPPSDLTELKIARVKVDSSFDGYNAAPLTDGRADVREIAKEKYNKGNWASAETPGAHWIEMEFDGPVRLAAVYVYWGFDRNRFVPSRRVELQTPDDGGAWRTISSIETGSDYDRAAFDFPPVSAARARILQPPRQGPPTRPFVMWVREVKAFAFRDGSGAK
ncbi:MAG TPA: protein kinase [Pyrinomonadaceae bacterium]